jgi:hypothetical protein
MELRRDLFLVPEEVEVVERLARVSRHMPPVLAVIREQVGQGVIPTPGPGQQAVVD